MPPDTSLNFQPPKGRSLGGALSLMSIYTRSDEFLLSRQEAVVSLGNELPRVFVLAIPSRLGSCKRSRVAVRARLEIEDCVDSL